MQTGILFRALVFTPSILALYVCLVACSDHNQIPSSAFAHELKQNTDMGREWQLHSYAYFSKDSLSTSGFVEALNRIVNDINTGAISQASYAEMQTKAYQPSISFYMATHDHPAAKERIAKRFKMNLLFQHLSFDALFLNKSDQNMIAKGPDFQDFLGGIQGLIEAEPVLNKGSFRIYQSSDEKRLFALERKLGNRRAYIAFNLSYDMQTMPFPYGFMSSTKVGVWRIEEPVINTYVSDGKIEILPFSAIVVLVG